MHDDIEKYVMGVIDSWPEKDVRGYAIERMLSYYINSATTDELLQFFDNPERNIWKLRQLQSQPPGGPIGIGGAVSQTDLWLNDTTIIWILSEMHSKRMISQWETH